ncbi:nucleotide pyrophosphohydrolase [Deinococcus cellulosilyticus]|uniref:NTP pyrophosphohydrolase n=1 Tax=Deinococcus cellulosilyticus (strain DSM 18568 / NBRC 106333 / KACC 11606 / 5516J-15) TaxID=1223518 RepID=A0A511N563_DEIC1|nr:nucleotide pyrophosphohydrolase [Deinococcus cellulosilyticus]GEM47980.1 NTP pyrophosphohydrolase [Deinococcus cellulosilyticus NBRC 106333 = KACC 11606]
MDFSAVQNRQQAFIEERGWQDFQTPKNLVMALMVESAELQEIFQWLTPEESWQVRDKPGVLEHVGEEAADILLYLLHLCRQLNIDLEQAVNDKMQKNAVKYPLGSS